MADEPKPPARRPPVVPPTVPPTVPPVVKPVAPPVVAPVVAPVSAPTRAPAPVVAPVVAPVGAPAQRPAEPDAAAPGSVTTHYRASDRVAAYSGAPTALLLAAAALLLGAVGGLVAWSMARVPSSAVVDAADALGASAARVLAAMEPDWWEAKHGTAGEMREHALKVLEKEETTIRALPEGAERDRLKADLALAREKFLPMILPDRRGDDDLLEARNRERFRNLSFRGALVGVALYDTSQRPMLQGAGMPIPERVEKDGDGFRGWFRIADREGREVRGRLYLAPVTGRTLDAETHRARLAGYAGVALSLEPALALAEASEKRALVAGGAALGAGLIAAILCWAFLAPLRRVLRDAEEFSRGNFDHRATASGGGEIGALARAVARSALAARDREAEALAKAAAAVPPPADHRPVAGAALAPAAPLRVDGWEAEGTSRACFEIAGDAFDTVAAGGGRFACVLVETSLRGLPAAFLAAETKNLFRGLAPHHDAAGVLLDALGSIVGPRVPEGEEVHAVVVMADPGTGEAEIARAGGGNPPVLWRAAGRELEKVAIEGPPIRRADGAGTGASAAGTTVSLQPRDRLTLVSDGMFRVRNSRKEKFGEQRLDGLVLKFGPMNSTAFVNMVVNEVDLFHEGAAQRDDLTVLTVRRLK